MGFFSGLGFSIRDSFRVCRKKRKTTIAYFFSKTDRDCVPFLHFYHTKIVNIDMRRMDVLNTNLDGYERN